MQDNEFEWSDRKAADNYADHGITFEMARDAFGDPFAVDKSDDREDYSEDRYNLVGMREARLLHVTYTYRGDRIRIISARLAERRERRWYHEGN